MTLKLKSVWRQLGRLGRIFVLLLAAYFTFLWVAPASGFTILLQFAAIVLAVWILSRLIRVGLRKAIWRLRNRLIVTYVLIAVVPILLIFTLAGLASYMLASQVAVYLARSSLDRVADSMRAATDALMGADPKLRAQALRSTGEIYQERFPNVVLLIADHGVVQSWPEETAIDPPLSKADTVNGVVWRNGRYYAWSLAARSGAQFVAMTPLTRRSLSEMVPGLGDVYFLQMAAAPAESQAKKGGFRVTTQTPRESAVSIGNDRFDLEPSGREAAATVLPPPVNRFDLGVRWYSLVRAADWNETEHERTALLQVHTRFSSLFDVILSQKSDEFQGLLPIIFYIVTIAFLIVEIVSLIIGVSLTRTITSAVHSLYEGTQRVMQSDFSHRIKVSGGDQIAELSRSFNTMTENLERLLAIAKEKERMQAELEIAREVQNQLYPKTAPSLKRLRVTGMCQPARMVSGDYYDYQAIAKDRLAIAIGDVAGKGISAALLMAAIQSAMRMEVRTSLEYAELSHTARNGIQLSTARMVSDLNQQLHATSSPEKFATFCMALYDDETGEVTYTNAGHLPPLLIREGTATRWDVNGTVVGAFPFAKYGESKMELRSGDLLVYYTDGITEPENEYGEMYGEERLIEFVIRNAEREDHKIVEALMESVRQWTSSPELSDDMTVVLARRQ